MATEMIPANNVTQKPTKTYSQINASGNLTVTYFNHIHIRHPISNQTHPVLIIKVLTQRNEKADLYHI